MSSSLPQNRIINMTFDCNTNQLDFHIEISEGVEVIPGVLSFNNLVLSLRVTIDTPPTFNLIILSANTQLFSIATFVAVQYNFATRKIEIKGIPTDTNSLSIDNALQAVSGTSLPVPSSISTLSDVTFTGQEENGVTTIAIEGKSNEYSVTVVLQKSSSKSIAALIADIRNFYLASFVNTAINIDITDVPLFGTLTIPELGFEAATGEITSDLLPTLYTPGSRLEAFGTTLPSGVSAFFIVDIAGVSVNAAFSLNKLTFNVPSTSSLSVKQLRDQQVRDILNSLPSQLSSVFDAQIATFSYDPVSTELQFSGSLDSTVDIVPGFMSLSNVQISLILVLGEDKYVETLHFSGDWNLEDLPIHTTVSYNRAENRLDIVGELDEANNGVSVPELITSLSGESLPIPSVLSSVKLSKLSGNTINDITLVTLSGSVSKGQVFLIYQKSPSGSAVAFAADTPEFRFSSLVSSATGIDISSIPFFGTLIIPQIGFTMSSAHISNPLLLDLYPPTSPLATFGSSIAEGVTASFDVSFGDVKGIVADFAKGELDLEVPDSVELSLTDVLQQIPGLQGGISSLPQTIQDIGSTKLYFIPGQTTSELQLRGSLDSLEIIPDFLSLQNIDLEFASTIG